MAFSIAVTAADAARDEFTAKAGDYDAPFGEASAAIKQIILDEGFDVVGVADFTDLAGQPLQIGRLYAEEFATRLVGPRKKYRLLDPATLLGLVDASGGTSLWATPDKIRQFGAKSKVELVVTGRIEIAAKEARFFIKAVATEDAGVVWAKTIAVPGVSAAAADAAAKVEADSIAAQTKLVPMPDSAETGSDAVASAVSGLFTGGASAEPAAPSIAAATTAPGMPVASTTPIVSAPAASAAAATPSAPSPTPPSPTAPSPTAPNPSTTNAPAVAAAAATVVATQAPKPVPAAPAPKPAAPAAAASAPIATGASAVTAVAATAAAGVAAAASTPAPAPKPAAAPPLPPEVLTFENAWLRARVRSASKYEGSGWVTAVLDLTNLSDRPIKLDAAQDDPGKGVDELGNNWRIERVSGLKLANGTGTANTTLNPSSTVSVVVVLATSAQPSGRRLSFGPNLYWFGSAAVGDSGRVAVAFSNIRVN